MHLFAYRQGDLLPLIKIICFIQFLGMPPTIYIQAVHMLSYTGFGFFVDKEGNMTKKPQVGGVLNSNFIFACTTFCFFLYELFDDFKLLRYGCMESFPE